jgi:hypothetical protein
LTVCSLQVTGRVCSLESCKIAKDSRRSSFPRFILSGSHGWSVCVPEEARSDWRCAGERRKRRSRDRQQEK